MASLAWKGKETHLVATLVRAVFSLGPKTYSCCTKDRGIR